MQIRVLTSHIHLNSPQPLLLVARILSVSFCMSSPSRPVGSFCFYWF